MMARYISTEVEWTEAMKVSFRQKLLKSVQEAVHHDQFEVSAHLNEGRHAPLEMWVILQVFDGHRNLVVREEGDTFEEVLQSCILSVMKGLKQRTPLYLKTREAL